MATDPIYVAEEAARRMNSLMQDAERELTCTPSCRSDRPDRQFFRFLITGLTGDLRTDNQIGSPEIDIIGWARLIEGYFGRNTRCHLSRPFGFTTTVMCIVVPRDMGSWALRSALPSLQSTSNGGDHPIFVAEEATRRMNTLIRRAERELACAPSCKTDRPDRHVIRFLLNGITSDTNEDNRIGTPEIDVMGWSRCVEGLFGRDVKCRISQPRGFITTEMCIVVSRNIDTWAACETAVGAYPLVDVPQMNAPMDSSAPPRQEDVHLVDSPPPYSCALQPSRLPAAAKMILRQHVPIACLLLAAWYAACRGANLSPWETAWAPFAHNITSGWVWPDLLFTKDGPIA